MHGKLKVTIASLTAEVFSAVCVSLCVLPGFMLIGDIIAQFSVTAICAFIFLIFADKLLKINAETISHSLIFMTLFWLLFALIKQTILHIQYGDYSLNWFNIFYYDRPAMLFVVFFITIIYYIIKLLLNSGNAEFIKSYSNFIKNTTVCLLIYYFIILIYCFILTRHITSVRPDINLIPFETIITTFSLGRIDYELLFLFLGNIAIFFPIGFFLPAIVKNKFIIAAVPVIISVTIEISQYFLGNGYPDIDDVILNITGFYLGVALKTASDKLLLKFSSGKLKSIFIF